MEILCYELNPWLWFDIMSLAHKQRSVSLIPCMTWNNEKYWEIIMIMKVVKSVYVVNYK